MPMTSGVVIVYALRLATLIWPLSTEVLAMLWWAPVNGPSSVPTVLIIAMYIALVFAPNHLLFSRLGVAAAVLLIAASLVLVLRYWGDPIGMPQMIWVHLGFGAAWLLALLIDAMIRRNRDRPSTGISAPRAR